MFLILFKASGHCEMSIYYKQLHKFCVPLKKITAYCTGLDQHTGEYSTYWTLLGELSYAFRVRVDMSQSTVQQYLSLRRQERCEEASLYAALQLYKARAQGWQGIFTPLLTSAKPSRRVQKSLAKFKRLYRGRRFRAGDRLTALGSYSALKQQVNYRFLWPAT